MSRRRWIVLAGTSMTLVVALVVAIVSWTGTSTAQAAQLNRTSTACHMWASADTTPVPPAWCSDMVGWMRQEMSERNLTGTMMWSSPATMRDTCRRWAATEGFDASRCDDMVDWMSRHASDWTGWMMRGRGMMGRR